MSRNLTDFILERQWVAWRNEERADGTLEELHVPKRKGERGRRRRPS